MPLPKVSDARPMLGCDPEFFFKVNGEVIGAEKFLPKDGMKAGAGSKFIIDGVQAELNPRPNDCRANLANEIRACFITLNNALKTRPEIQADFSRAIEISKENLMELDEKSRKFGCAPSKSVYRKTAGLKIGNVDPAEYRVRAAGGHIHIGKGTNPNRGIYLACTTKHDKTVKMLDLLCGNTAVLIDRDAANIERRKVYGKAGEFRLPEHGLEYRTLSNFWLTAYPLMSFAFGMARLAVQLVADTKNSDMFFHEFMSKVKPKNVKDAINNNDFDQAMENYLAIEKLIGEAVAAGENYPIHGENLKEFLYFANSVKDNGLGHWFKQDPMTHWTKLTEAHEGGFHDFLRLNVGKEMRATLLKEKKQEAKAIATLVKAA